MQVDANPKMPYSFDFLSEYPAGHLMDPALSKFERSKLFDSVLKLPSPCVEAITSNNRKYRELVGVLRSVVQGNGEERQAYLERLFKLLVRIFCLVVTNKLVYRFVPPSAIEVCSNVQCSPSTLLGAPIHSLGPLIHPSCVLPSTRCVLPSD